HPGSVPADHAVGRHRRARGGVYPRHGRARADPAARRADDPAGRQAARPRHRDRLHRPAPRREAARNPVPRRRTLPPDRASQDPAGRGAFGLARQARARDRPHARCRGGVRHGGARQAAARDLARIPAPGRGARARGHGHGSRIPRKTGTQDMTQRIRKAVFPVAGLGTRFLPATKTVPKEMLPIVDRPLIQYAVDEAIEAGCDTLVFVTNRYKHAVADYFDKAYELEQKLEKSGKREQLELVRNVLREGVRAVFVTQAEALGLGHAVLCAKAVVGDRPFAVLLPDDLIWNKGGDGALKQMVDHAEASGAGAIAVQDVPREQTASYGIVATDAFADRHGAIRRIVEKPRPEDAPSTLAVVGRYVLPPAIFDHLERTGRGAGGEIQLTDAIASLLDEQRVDAYRFQGTRFDCGTHIGLVEATIRFALDHEKISDAARESMARALQELGVIDL